MQGLVTEIIGQADDQGIDVLEVLASMDIVSEFPKEVLDQAEAVPEEVPENEIVGRVDYRNEITFTIDGADAKDLDDAVHAKRLENGNYELGVHIADVSHYVTENSPLDKEAYERGTSVYVTDRVVPMLPERLSNGICSLNPRINRLTQSCVMEISPEGRVINYQISQSIIKTTERMTYDAVNQMIAGDEAALENYAKIADSVKIMVELHHILEAMRKRRGAIDFDTVEAKIIVNEKGLPIEIRKRTRGIAERMIESFMLEANETVATHFEAHGLPFIYRIHEQPKADRLQRFIDFAATFGMQIEGTSNGIDQKVLQAFMKKIKGQPGEMVLSTMLLRSMQQARYSENNQGHFGLAAENYTHFTSPIRRYPDLLVHRLIREIGEGKTPANILQKWEDKIPEIAEHSSHRERRAVDAEREVEKMKKAEFMEEHVGEEYEGIIASVTRFGMFIELENTIEGLVHISTLKGDYFNYQERMLALIGERSGLTFKIGQPIKIKVVKADRMTGEIDFEYLPSELDLIDKAAKAKKKPDHKGRKKSNQSLKVKSVAPKSTDKSANKSKNGRRADEKSEFDKKKKKSAKKPFYSKAAKGKFTDKKDNGKKFTDGRKKPHKRG
jgi:ribonuclease R